MTPPPVVPFSRPLYGPGRHHSDPGLDVLAFKRGLWRAGYFEGPASAFDEQFNHKAVEAAKAFQRHVGILATGNVGIATWTALRNTHKKNSTEWAFDAAAEKLAVRYATTMQETPAERAQRLGVDSANFWIVHRDQSDYEQVRPFPVIKPPVIAPKLDCSGFVTDVYYAAEAPDPNDRGYDGQGYTGTLVGHGREVSIHEIDLLDLVFYGFTVHATPAFPYGSPTHVTVFIGGGYVASDGSQSGPQKRDIHYRPGQASNQNPMGLHSVRRYPLH